jgi:hypothetical protein
VGTFDSLHVKIHGACLRIRPNRGITRICQWAALPIAQAGNVVFIATEILTLCCSVSFSPLACKHNFRVKIAIGWTHLSLKAQNCWLMTCHTISSDAIFTEYRAFGVGLTKEGRIINGSSIRQVLKRRRKKKKGGRKSRDGKFLIGLSVGLLALGASQKGNLSTARSRYGGLSLFCPIEKSLPLINREWFLWTNARYYLNNQRSMSHDQAEPQYGWIYRR